MKETGNQPHKLQQKENFETLISEPMVTRSFEIEKQWIPTIGKNSGKHGPKDSFLTENLVKESTKDKPMTKTRNKESKEKSKASMHPNLSKNKLPDQTVQTKKQKSKWNPVKVVWEAGKTKFLGVMLWNINSGSEAHCFIAEERLKQEMVDVAVLPEGQNVKPAKYQGNQTYKRISSHGKGAGVSLKGGFFHRGYLT
eukprot:GHVP01009844.1.p1 GENE.GHVP01009844.1~~GHVP01009844.1.p1  ORF type:complete len:211 (+),score=44.71 GHVP01009844.1:44-634(+)